MFCNQSSQCVLWALHDLFVLLNYLYDSQSLRNVAKNRLILYFANFPLTFIRFYQIVLLTTMCSHSLNICVLGV